MNNGNKPLSGGSPNAKKLLNLSVDWITLNIMRTDTFLPPSISYLASIFELPHNDTNNSYYEGHSWPTSDYCVGFNFLGKNRQGDAVQIMSEDGFPMMRIVMVDKKVSRNKHEYQIGFTGMFFDYHRLGYFSAKDFMKLFLDDISANDIQHSVSRLDICSDVANASVSDVFLAKKGPKSFRKKHTIYAVDPITEIPQGIGYGKKKDDWMLRIYNKLMDAIAKKKERFYADYFKYPMVTRIELELHSDKCLEFLVTLEKCFDKDFLLSVYSEVLYQKKYTKFKIVNFVKKELKHNRPALERRNYDPFPLEEAKYLKDVASRYKNACKRYGYTEESLLPEFLTLIGVSSNQKPISKRAEIKVLLAPNQNS